MKKSIVIICITVILIVFASCNAKQELNTDKSMQAEIDELIKSNENFTGGYRSYGCDGQHMTGIEYDDKHHWKRCGLCYEMVTEKEEHTYNDKAPYEGLITVYGQAYAYKFSKCTVCGITQKTYSPVSAE